MSTTVIYATVELPANYSVITEAEFAAQVSLHILRERLVAQAEESCDEEEEIRELTACAEAEILQIGWRRLKAVQQMLNWRNTVLVEVGSSPRTYSLTTMGLDYDESQEYCILVDASVLEAAWTRVLYPPALTLLRVELSQEEWKEYEENHYAWATKHGYVSYLCEFVQKENP